MNNLLSIEELTGEQICELLALGHKLKAERGCHAEQPLAGQTWALIFSKSSTRTRVSFEVGISELPLISLIFLKRSLVFPILLFSSISLH